MKEIIIIAVLILLNGLFSLSELALISARKAKLSNDAKRGNKAAKAALQLTEAPEKFLSTIQIGITLIGILTGIYSGATLADNFSIILVQWGMAPAIAHPIAQGVIVVIVTYLSIVVGELVPKKIGMSKADSIARIVARPMKWLSTLALPFVWILSHSTLFITKLMGITQDDNKVTEEEIKSIIQEGTEAGEVQEVEQDIIERVLVLGDMSVESIMTSRKDLVYMDLEMTTEEIRTTIAEDIHSSYPVIDGDIDNIKGFVSLKNLILNLEKPHFNLSSIITPATYIPETMSVYNALEEFRTDKMSSALVIDEYGTVQGIVTLRNILAGLIGSHENIDGNPHIVPRNDGESWLVDGMCPIYDFLAYFEQEELYEPDEYATVSGLILKELKYIPTVSKQLTWKSFSFEVVDMDGLRIDKLLVKRNYHTV